MSALLCACLVAAPCFAAAPKFTVVSVDTRTQRLELFLRDERGAPFLRFERLERWLASRQQRLRFAMNA